MAITTKKLTRNAQKLGLRLETYEEIRSGRILALADINALMHDAAGELKTPSTSFAQCNGSVPAGVIQGRHTLMSHMIEIGQQLMQRRPIEERLTLKPIGPHFDAKANVLSLQADIMRQMYLTQPEPPVMSDTIQTKAMKQTYKKAIARNMVGGVALLKQGRSNGPQ